MLKLIINRWTEGLFYEPESYKTIFQHDKYLSNYPHPILCFIKVLFSFRKQDSYQPRAATQPAHTVQADRGRPLSGGQVTQLTFLAPDILQGANDAFAYLSDFASGRVLTFR